MKHEDPEERSTPLPPSDETLVQAALGGDASGFDQLMRRHAGAVRILIARYFRNRDQVDDLAQENFVRAFFSLTSYRGEAPGEPT